MDHQYILYIQRYRVTSVHFIAIYCISILVLPFLSISQRNFVPSLEVLSLCSSNLVVPAALWWIWSERKGVGAHVFLHEVTSQCPAAQTWPAVICHSSKHTQLDRVPPKPAYTSAENISIWAPLQPPPTLNSENRSALFNFTLVRTRCNL